MAKRCRTGCECRTGGAQPNLSHRTAIDRRAVSAPALGLFTDGALRGRVLDYGCGKGADVRWLNMRRIEVSPVVEGYDPYWRPRSLVGKFDTILCTYVLNVIEDYTERVAVLNRMAELLAPSGQAYVTVRRDLDSTGRTRSGTWQGIIELHGPGLSVRAKRNAYETYALSSSDLYATMPLTPRQLACVSTR